MSIRMRDVRLHGQWLVKSPEIRRVARKVAWAARLKLRYARGKR